MAANDVESRRGSNLKHSEIGALSDAASLTSIQPSEQVVGSLTVPQQPELLSKEQLLTNSKFWKRITELNNNVEPHTIYAVGEFPEVFAQIQKQTKDLNQNDLVFLSIQ